jgi:hypothetical protein
MPDGLPVSGGQGSPLLDAYIAMQARRVKDAVTAPRDAYRGDLQIFDPATGHVSDEAMDRANGMAGIAMTGGLSGVARGGTTIGAGPIRAYHGSPHSFDKFSSKAMGSGEGAQAYGAGTYFAEAEPVAMGYRDRLTPAGQKGSMYEVGIDAPPEAFIDHAKPLNQQSQLVQDAFASLGRGKTVPSWRPDKTGTYEIGGIKFDPEMTGMQAYRQLDSNPAVATEKLKEAGVAGIRYRDAGSRDGSGSATNNLVVFNDDLVSILRKYGLAGVAALGAGGGAVSNLGMGGPPQDMRY